MKLRCQQAACSCFLSFVVGASVAACKERPVNGDSTAAPSAAASANVEAAPRGDGPHAPVEIAFGELPKLPAPPPRFDGGPITLRAVKMDGRVGVWAYGTVPGAQFLYMKVRYYKDGVIRDNEWIGSSFAQQEGNWYPVDSNILNGERANAGFDQFAAQVAIVQGLRKEEVFWKPAPQHGDEHTWGYPMPEKVTHEVAGSPVGFAVIATEVERRKTGDKLDARVVLGIYNGGDVPLSKIEYGVKVTDEQRTLAETGGLWSSSDDQKTIPPKSWARSDFGADAYATRLQEVRFAFTVVKTTPAP